MSGSSSRAGNLPIHSEPSASVKLTFHLQGPSALHQDLAPSPYLFRHAYTVRSLTPYLFTISATSTVSAFRRILPIRSSANRLLRVRASLQRSHSLELAVVRKSSGRSVASPISSWIWPTVTLSSMIITVLPSW